MTPQTTAGALGAVALLMFAAVLVLLRRRSPARRRLRYLRLTTLETRPVRPRQLIRLVAVAAGVAVALLVSGWAGLVLGVVAGLLVDRGVRKIEPPGARAARERARADLPFALDLTAAALSAGAPPGAAARAVGSALGGALGDRLDQVGRALALGAAPAQAWSALAGIPGSDRFAAAMVRGSQSGAALARSLLRLSDDLRSAGLAETEAVAHRAGVLIVLPLGLCFLPAFVTGGLVPVVISMLGTVLP